MLVLEREGEFSALGVSVRNLKLTLPSLNYRSTTAASTSSSTASSTTRSSSS